MEVRWSLTCFVGFFALLSSVLFVATQKEPKMMLDILYLDINTPLWRSQLTEKIGHRKPFLINTRLINDWNQTLWEPSTLLEIIQKEKGGDILRNCKNGTSPLFVLSSQGKRSYTVQDIPTRDFFHAINHSEDYLYYAAPLEKFTKTSEESDIFTSLFPLVRHFRLDEFDIRHNINQNMNFQSQSVVWMGSGGVTANCHYDRSHNIFTQLSGIKRWTLFPPTDYESMYIYPSYHPSYHQSQVGRVEAEEDPIFPLFLRHSPTLQIDLYPGDILYIPPFWFHQVETLSPFAASLSVISPSFEEEESSLLFWDAKHFWDGLTVTENQKLAALHYLTRELLSLSYPEDITKGFYSLIISRTLHWESNKQFKSCTAVKKDISNGNALQHLSLFDSPPLPLSFHLSNYIGLSAKKYCESLLKLPGGSKHIVTANLIEHLFSTVIPSPFLAPYLQLCVGDIFEQ